MAMEHTNHISTAYKRGYKANSRLDLAIPYVCLGKCVYSTVCANASAVVDCV